MSKAPRTSLIALLALAGLGWGQETPSEDKSLELLHERLLSEHKLPTRGPALLDFFRDKTLSAEQIARIKSVIDQLSDPVYATRVHADAELTKLAKRARPVFMETVLEKHRPPETRRRLELLLKNNPEGDEPAIAESLAFFIAREKPAEAAKVLLDYLPFATNPNVIRAIRGTLPVLALTGSKPYAAVTAALRDTHSLKRAIAGEALIRAGGLVHKPLVAHLLTDAHKEVHWQVLAALVEARDKDAVPRVIELLGELSRDTAWDAEDLLCRVAGEKAPAECLGMKLPAEKVVKAWLEWWEKNQAEVDLSKISEPPLLGHTLVTHVLPASGLKGKVMEVRPTKEVLWEISDIKYPVDAHVIGRDRVLIAEYYGRRVTERDFKGNILWEKEIDTPIACQRLAGGDTFIATRRQLLVVDRDGKDLVSYFHTTSSISAAHRSRSGRMLLVDAAGQLTHLDAAGKVAGSFPVGQVYSLGANIDVQAGGRILVPVYRENRLVEYNLEGKETWSVSVPNPVSATRLPGGNILVVSQGKMRVVEIDRHGKEVWGLDVEGRAWRARKR